MLVWNCFDLSNQRRKQNWNPSMIFWRFKMKKAHSCTFYHGSIPIRPFAIENFNWKFLFFCAIYYIYAAKTNLNKPMSYWLYKLLVLFSFLTASYWNKTRLKSLFFNLIKGVSIRYAPCFEFIKGHKLLCHIIPTVFQQINLHRSMSHQHLCTSSMHN